jgi:hypothetical protein
MGTPFQEIQMAVSLSQNHIVVASPNTTSRAGLYARLLHFLFLELTLPTSLYNSYTPSSSSTFVAGGITADITGLDGSLTTASFAGEACQILDFNYNASRKPLIHNLIS